MEKGRNGRLREWQLRQKEWPGKGDRVGLRGARERGTLVRIKRGFFWAEVRWDGDWEPGRPIHLFELEKEENKS